MTGSNRAGPDLPPWSNLPAGGAAPAYVMDAGRRAALEALAGDAFRAAGLPCLVLPTPGTPWPRCLPAPLVAERGRVAEIPSSAGGTLILGVAPPHHPSSPWLASPYDGTAFEVALEIRPRCDRLLLATGAPDEALAPRAWGARLDELGRFAYELRRATGLEASGLALAGGTRPPFRPWRARPGDPAPLARAWGSLARHVASMAEGWGLPIREIWIDLGPACHALSVRLVAAGGDAVPAGVVAPGVPWR